MASAAPSVWDTSDEWPVAGWVARPVQDQDAAVQIPRDDTARETLQEMQEKTAVAPTPLISIETLYKRSTGSSTMMHMGDVFRGSLDRVDYFLGKVQLVAQDLMDWRHVAHWEPVLKSYIDANLAAFDAFATIELQRQAVSLLYRFAILQWRSIAEHGQVAQFSMALPAIRVNVAACNAIVAYAAGHKAEAARLVARTCAIFDQEILTKLAAPQPAVAARRPAVRRPAVRRTAASAAAYKTRTAKRLASRKKKKREAPPQTALVGDGSSPFSLSDDEEEEEEEEEA